MLAQLGGLLGGSQRLKRKRREQRKRAASELFPTLLVRQLEERRVFHAGAIAAPTAGATVSQPPPAPPPTTTVTLDSSHNLLVQDGSATGQNDQLTIRLNATQGRYEIYDPAHRLATDIAGATGNGTNRVYVPVEAVTGNKLIFATGG